MSKTKQREKLLARAIEAAESGNTIEAEELFAKLLEDPGESPGVFYNCGIFFGQQGEHIKASENFHKAMELMPGDEATAMRTVMEDLHIGCGEVFETDFMAFDPTYLLKAKEICEKFLAQKPEDAEWKETLERVENKISQNRLAFRFFEGDLDYCRRTVTRKKELNKLDERVMGFLNLLDSGEYDFVDGRFGVFLKSDLPREPRQGFLDRIRTYLLGK